MKNQQMSISDIVQTEGWKQFMKKLEIAAFVLLILSYILHISGLAAKFPTGTINTLSLNTFAVVCFFMAFNTFQSESKVLSFLFYKIYGFGLSIGFIASLFLIQKWPFPSIAFMIVSIIASAISLILGFREKRGENVNKINWVFFVRIAILMITVLYALQRSQIAAY
jgi:hypothetical protein